MKSPFSKFNIIFSASILLIVAGLVAFGVYTYEQNMQTNLALSAKISSLESQATAFGSALQNSNTINQANKQQLQDMAKKSNAAAPVSPDNLLTSVVARASPAVVSVVVSKDVPLLQVQYVNPFGNDPNSGDAGLQVPIFNQVGTKQEEVAIGSGFIIRSNGYIVTNKHVVSDPQAEYTVLLSTGEKRTAQVVYRDSTQDIAILKISGNGYATIPIGDSSGLKLGQTVAAIGNALGQYNNSVSVGIVSGLNRTIEAQDTQGQVEILSGIVQTDAAINSGNSGGPLLDLSGKVIGINVAMEQGANNISFAIPVNEVKSIINKVVP